VTGCYEYNEGVLNGGIEGRIIKITWQEGDVKGPAVMVFTSDGEKFYGLWWSEGQVGEAGIWSGVNKSQEVGGCPHWAGGVQEQMAKDLSEFGRVRIYGINFDIDSKAIMVSPNQSHPTPRLSGWLRIGVWNWLKSKKDVGYIGIGKYFLLLNHLNSIIFLDSTINSILEK